jgi:hypothetical protein
MAGRRLLVPGLVLFAAAAVVAVWYSGRPEQPGRLVLRIHPFVGPEPLELNRVRYANPGGEGTFKVRDFQFFLGNVRLVADGSEFVEPESYHLARFDGGDGTHSIVIEDVPREDYGRIEFGIGVDAEANGSIASVGELDPNGRMAWSWDVGYKFVLVEGGIVVGDVQSPLVYHVGFDENYKRVSLELDGPLFDGLEGEVHLRADLKRMFQGSEAVDMSALSTVKFDRADSKLLADNFASMVSLCSCDRGR